MARLVSRLQVAMFVVVGLVASPVILFKFGVDWLCDRIEARWPDSHRAQIVIFWFRLLAPLVLCIVLTVLLMSAIGRLRARHGTR